MNDLAPSMPSSVTERRLGNALKLLRNLSLELEDVIAHLTLQRKSDKMTATTGEERAGGMTRIDCASALSDPFSASLWEDYD